VIEESTCEEAIVEDLAECPECFNLFESNKIAKHIASHTKQSFSCDQCDYTASKLNQLENHCQKVHEKESCSAKVVKRKQCVICGMLVKNLQEHVKLTHSQIKRFYCDNCNYSCYFKTKINRHIQKHIPKSERKLFKCTEKECPFECSRKDALKSHILTMHQTDRKRSFDCRLCDKAFFNKSQLGIHTKAVHEKIRTNTCSICGKSFFNAKDLSMHETRHFEKKEKCSECDALFYCTVDLKRHIKNRHTAPNIECEFPECGKKFHSNSKLKAHIKTRHEHLKDFLCSFCDSTFSQYNNLKRHIDSVHKALRIACVIQNCNYSVSRKDKYKNHLISQHKFDEKTRNSILKNIKFE
jgi:KRAB domain-containing zinc finger protein